MEAIFPILKKHPFFYGTILKVQGCEKIGVKYKALMRDTMSDQSNSPNFEE